MYLPLQFKSDQCTHALTLMRDHPQASVPFALSGFDANEQALGEWMDRLGIEIQA